MHSKTLSYNNNKNNYFMQFPYFIQTGLWSFKHLVPRITFYKTVPENTVHSLSLIFFHQNYTDYFSTVNSNVYAIVMKETWLFYLTIGVVYKFNHTRLLVNQCYIICLYVYITWHNIPYYGVIPCITVLPKYLHLKMTYQYSVSNPCDPGCILVLQTLYNVCKIQLML